ncbi:hypothetical protein [Mameliella alba]|uniref:hypothetical protein n=1 Tax=Mameliella alba TaxID=561184 RepID=UPI001432261B|nr:hypothetical protein [Mameliella alba]
MDRARWYDLPTVVARLRERRKRGCFGDDLAALVDADTFERLEIRGGQDELFLGDDALGRSVDFYAALVGEEAPRASAVRREVRKGAVSAGLIGVDRLSQVALLQPGIVRYILTGQADELPRGDGWRSFTSGLWAVNAPDWAPKPMETNEQQETA